MGSGESATPPRVSFSGDESGVAAVTAAAAAEVPLWVPFVVVGALLCCCAAALLAVVGRRRRRAVPLTRARVAPPSAGDAPPATPPAKKAASPRGSDRVAPNLIHTPSTRTPSGVELGLLGSSFSS